MDEEWNEYVAGKCDGKCDVVVSLVRRSTNICASASADQGSPATDVCASASTDQGSPAMDVRNARKRKSLSNPEEEDQNWGDVHVNSGRSKYFDTCLGERWAGTEVITSQTPMHLTLDVHTDVKYYRDCFSRMCSGKYQGLPNVKDCLKLLQVASQISYLELIEDCIRYLTSIQWSCEDEKIIRSFANSGFYPSDCAGDLSARLGLSLSNTERHSLLLDVTADALCVCFNDYMVYGYEEDLTCSQRLFSSSFRVFISGPGQSSAEKILKHVNDGIKKIILETRDHRELNATSQGFENVPWILKLLLETRCATALVEYIVDESPLNAMLLRHYSWALKWVDPIHSVFKEVIEGRLLLKASTRYMLYKNWARILELGNYEGEDEDGPYQTLSTFFMTFPYETQKKIISDWMAYERGPVIDENDHHFMKIHASLLKKISWLGLRPSFESIK